MKTYSYWKYDKIDDYSMQSWDTANNKNELKRKLYSFYGKEFCIIFDIIEIKLIK